LRAAAAALLATVLVVGACGGGGGDHAHDEEASAVSSTASTAPPFVKADATTAVDVVLQDYAFVGLPDTVVGPNVHLTASIKGSNTHELMLYDEDDELVEDLRPFKRPARQALAVVLEPGTYSARCLIKEGSRTHAELGMRKTFTVS
jgi:hypothetical protein